ncbi:MAG: hypothetical protein ACWGNP_04285, partial [Candidatus Bathyarchaeia archaeon]
ADVVAKLDGYHTEIPYEEGDYNFTLVTEVAGLLPKENTITGVYSHDYVVHIFHRGKTAPLPRTVEALFSLAQADDTTFLTVVEKKRVANFVANKLSELIFDKAGSIVEARIPPETLRDFHLKNPEDTKITFFDNVDIPNVNKLSLYGPDLINAQLFEDYMKHGDLWYVVARSKETGYVVGVTRDASVTIFNSADKNRYIEYVNKEIYPIILGNTQ